MDQTLDINNWIAFYTHKDGGQRIGFRQFIGESPKESIRNYNMVHRIQVNDAGEMYAWLMFRLKTFFQLGLKQVSHEIYEVRSREEFTNECTDWFRVYQKAPLHKKDSLCFSKLKVKSVDQAVQRFLIHDFKWMEHNIVNIMNQLEEMEKDRLHFLAVSEKMHGPLVH